MIGISSLNESKSNDAISVYGFLTYSDKLIEHKLQAPPFGKGCSKPCYHKSFLSPTSGDFSHTIRFATLIDTSVNSDQFSIHFH